MKKKKIYIYHNQDLFAIADSLKDAADKTGIKPTTVYCTVRNKKTTRNGFFFSHRELTDEEAQNLEVKRNDCIKEVGTQVYEVGCNSPNVCYYPKKRSDKIEEFKTFLFTKFKERWLLIPKPLATLEREYIRDFLREMEK